MFSSLLNFFSNLYDKLSQKVPFLGLYIIFVMLGFRVLIYFQISFLNRVFYSLLLWLFLFYFNFFIFSTILNNRFFQYFLFLFYSLINLYCSHRFISSYLGFSLGFVPYLFSEVLYEGDFFFIYPSFETSFIFFFFFDFFRRFNAFVIIPEIKEGLKFRIVGKKGMSWNDIFHCIESYTNYEFPLQNKLYGKTYSFERFPFPDTLFKILVKLGLNKEVDILFKTIDKNISLEKSSENFLKMYPEVDDALVTFTQKRLVFEEAAKLATTRNNSFFLEVYYSYFSSVVLIFIILNTSSFLLFLLF